MADMIATPEIVALENAPVALTPVELIRIAVTQGADIDKLKQLMDLQERYEANAARKAFAAAMQRFKANPPIITKNHQVKIRTKAGGEYGYRHATLDHVCDEVTRGLSAVGITHAWKVRQEKDVITVVCKLTHELGHSEETELSGVPDNSGEKNSLQAVGSTVTYLERYSLLAACGLAAKNDDDGTASSKPIVSVEEIEKNVKEIAEAKSLETLKNIFGIAYAKAQELSDKKAMQHYITAKDKRKKELTDAAH
jgi:ERF superfamily